MKLFKILLASVVFMSGIAQAGLSESFVASNGKIFQVHSSISVEKGEGVIYVKQASGTVHPFQDTTGSVWLKVASYMNTATHHVRVPNTDRWMNTNFTTEISCVSNQTVFAYPTSTPAEWFQDGCSLQVAAQNLSTKPTN